MAALALVAAALLLPAGAHATPPTLTAAGESATTPGILTASWTLPAGMEAEYVDVATTKRTDAIGAFTLGVVLDSLAGTDTTWEASAALPPGTYYVHVAAIDIAKCNDPVNPDCIEEFSDVVEVTVAGDAIPPAHPPVLGTVAQDNGHLSADWTLATDESSDFIEVASAPDHYPGEGFLFENSVLFEFVGFTDTSFTSTQQLPPGTYYVHVAGTDDANCPTGSEPGCCIDEYSETKTITIPDLGPPPSPVLQSVGQDARHLTAAWTLPGGLENDFIEAATDPAVDTDGMFLRENTVLFDVAIEPTQTSYRSEGQLDPGTYYVHVGTYDPACFICPDVFTDALTVTIPPDPSAGGTGSGGSSGASGSQQSKPAQVAADKATAFRVLVAASKQRVDRLFVVASMAEAGTITAGGTVSVPGLSKVYKFKTASANAAPGLTVILKLKLPKKALKAVKKALKRHKKIKAKLRITARDKAGNTKAESRTVALKR